MQIRELKQDTSLPSTRCSTLLSLSHSVHYSSVSVAAPSQTVVALKVAYGRVKRPIGFRFICSILGSTSDSDACCLWHPIPPQGYVSLGCVAHVGAESPSLTSVYCVHQNLVTSASVRDCVQFCAGSEGFVLHGLSDIFIPFFLFGFGGRQVSG